MESFNSIWERACQRKGSEQFIINQLPQALSANQLSEISDDRFLAQMAKSIFQSGFVWRVVENKWNDFEQLFNHFNLLVVANYPQEKIEQLANDKRIIRNYRKIVAVQENANMMLEVTNEFGSFSQFIANWPDHDIVGLWAWLKKHGSRLGGNTGPYMLRQMGKATFLLTNDICAYLIAHKVVEKSPTSKTDLHLVQDFFIRLHQESGWDFAQLSKLIALSQGDNLNGEHINV